VISPTYTGPVYNDTNEVEYATENDGLGQDAFLKMFLAQVTNQDPLNPMDNTEFTAQLATFSQLEQLTNIAEAMEGINRMEQAIQTNTLMTYIGRDVTISGNKVPVNEGSSGTVGFNMEKTGDVRVVITNEAGVTVRAEELGFLTEGHQEYVWDGTDLWGETVANGTYTVTIMAYDHYTGDPITVSDMTVSALATGYEIDEDGNQYIVMGSSAVPVAEILGVRAPATTTTESTSEEEETTILEDVVDAAASAVSLLI
jgi:flagellar basal-body rod modification protein FlgD